MPRFPILLIAPRQGGKLSAAREVLEAKVKAGAHSHLVAPTGRPVCYNGYPVCPGHEEGDNDADFPRA